MNKGAIQREGNEVRLDAARSVSSSIAEFFELDCNTCYKGFFFMRIPCLFSKPWGSNVRSCQIMEL